MGKRPLVRRRGRGGNQFRSTSTGKVGKTATYPRFPLAENHTGEIIDLVHERGREAPLSKVRFEDGSVSFIPAVLGTKVGESLQFGLKSKIEKDKITPLGPIAPLTIDDADNSHRVVAMMGIEPFQEALERGAQVVIAGRSSDAAIYASVPLRLGADPGLSWHMGKIIECGAQVIEPREGQDCVIGTIYEDHLQLSPHIQIDDARGRVSRRIHYMKTPVLII